MDYSSVVPSPCPPSRAWTRFIRPRRIGRLVLELDEDLERSLRRGRHRRRARDAVLERRSLTVRELSDAIGVPVGRVVGILVGDPPKYSVERSLAAQGVVVVRQRGWAETWVVSVARGVPSRMMP